MQNITVETRADAEIFIRTAPKLEAAKSHPRRTAIEATDEDPGTKNRRSQGRHCQEARQLNHRYPCGRLNQPRNERGRSICLKAKQSQRAEFLNESIRLYFDILFSIKRSLDQSLDQSSLSINNLISHHNYLLQRRPRNRS
ncbi:hypothetical protein Pst134EA_031457 [Puccinia striiformis f. sp. tritici]|uniref:uncharacterized protein n=1 Tax=Puccinia striiformis f. sp. tritici TaxID=168172 RepID=UPI002008A656|nr:uncharacterized protein Pst134EA_031457 [Puccinia striiformis f. sp. tritici]KAH9442789.1 hypothetical protein Pst134EA_031457 [Puccinia striiformis f. sp. tritici]